MGLLTRLTRTCLRLAVRRWPAGLRADLLQAWQAELAVLERESPTAWWRRLAFAVSLAASPLTYDEDGLPRSRWEWRVPGPALRAPIGLLVAGGFGVGVWLSVQMLLNTLLLDAIWSHGADGYQLASLLIAAVASVLASGYAMVAGRWLGGRTHRARLRLRAGLAVGALGIVLAGWQSGSGDALSGVNRGGAAITVPAWALATFAVVVITSGRVAAGQRRRGWAWACAGVPLAAVLAPAVATLAGHTDGGPVRWEIPLIALRLVPLTVCTVAFGWVGARLRPAGVALGASVGGAAVDPVGGSVLEPVLDLVGGSGFERAAFGRAAGPVIASAGEPLDGAPLDGAPVDGAPVTAGRRFDAVRLAVTLAAAGAAVLWAIGLVVLQPLSEPPAGSAGSNNTYWARELRWDAIVAVVLAVVVCARARGRATGEALVGGLVWLALDIALDRVQPSHGTVGVAAIAAAVAVAGCYRATADRSVEPGAAHRAWLLVAAAVGAVLAGVSLLTESPSDTEPALNPGSAAASCVLGLITIGAAVSAAPRPSRTRYAIGRLAATLAATAPWLLRACYPHPTSARTLLGLGFTVLLVLCVALVAWRRPTTPWQWLRYPAAVTATLLVFPLVFMPALIALTIIDVGGLATALAGNPPIDSADEDVVTTIPALAAGLVLGWLLTRAESGRVPEDDRPGRRSC